MMINKKRLIFFDIDGTLIDNSTGKLPHSTVKALRQAVENGHRIFICTGRCQAIWPKEILDIGFDGVVGGCGTHIIYHGDELLHVSIEPTLAKEIAYDTVKYRIDGVLEGKLYHYFHEKPWMDVVKGIYVQNSGFVPEASETIEGTTDFDYDKMALWHDDNSDIETFKSKYEDRFDFIKRDPTFYEIVPKGYSKATGIEFLCERLGVDRDATMGVGDSTNDLPMLEYTGISVAMGSGNPDIFSKVDYVTAGVMDDGIEKALKKYEII